MRLYVRGVVSRERHLHSRVCVFLLYGLFGTGAARDQEDP